jgi:N-acetylneuraminic acid mutarotase
MNKTTHSTEESSTRIDRTAAHFLQANLTRRIALGLTLLCSLLLARPCAAAPGEWQLTGSLAAEREHHTATLLPSGVVLVAGGFDAFPVFELSSAELYNPATGQWTRTGSLHHARYVHSATLLSNGKVLVAGGIGDGSEYLASAELYDPASEGWTTTGSLAFARGQHTATLLPGGKVLVAGGANRGRILSRAFL